jgi:hypothetical protein
MCMRERQRLRLCSWGRVRSGRRSCRGPPLPGPVRAVYEAGPTGFELARAAREAGVELMVCAPGAIPRQPGDRIKTDTRDALKLARLHAAGQLRAVAARELPRARPVRALLGDQASAGSHNQSRLHSRPQTARRGGLALPPCAERLVGAQTPPEKSAACRDRRRVACTDPASSPLVAPRRVTREEAHHGRCCVARELACFVWEIVQQPD